MNIDLNAPATVYAQIPINNMVQAKRYIGSHLSTITIKDEEYFGSCDDPNFRLHRSNGWLRKITVYDGTLAECRSLEHQLLVHYNAATNNGFYNSSNGGGLGVSKDYKHDSNDFQRIIDIIDGKEIVLAPVEVNVALADVDAMETLVQEVKSGVYPIKELPVSLLCSIEKSQARLFTYVKENLDYLKGELTDPSEARKYISPISVTVDSEGNMVELVDGNHRLKAAEHNQWVTIPAYIIPVDKFNRNRQSITHYGNLMNDNRVRSAGNSIDDLKKRISSIAETLPHIKASSTAFKRIAIQQCGGGKIAGWPQSSIEYYCTDYEKRAEENRLRSNTNFQVYDRSDLTAYGNKLRFDSEERCVVEVQSVSKMTGSGFGGIQILMADAGVKKGIVLVHYPTYTDYLDRHKFISRVNNALEFFPFKQHGFVIELKFLDPFTKGKIVGLP
jgi:hypothetical protein